MFNSILLCGEGGDAAAAANFAFAEARARRMSRAEADRAATRVRCAYEEACRAVLPDALPPAPPALRLTLDRETLAPRFAYVARPDKEARSTPRALRIRALLAARAGRRPSALEA